MKAKEIINMLSGYEDYDVEICFYDKLQENYYVENKIPWPPFRHMDIGKIADVGVSDKIVLLNALDRE